MVSQIGTGPKAWCRRQAAANVVQVLDHLAIKLEAVAFPAPQSGEDPRQCPLCKEGRLQIFVSRKFDGAGHNEETVMEAEVETEIPILHVEAA